MNVVEPVRRGAANATLFSAFDIGIGLGALFLGMLAQAIGYRAMFLVEAGVLVIPMMMFLLVIIPRYTKLSAAT